MMSSRWLATPVWLGALLGAPLLASSENAEEAPEALVARLNYVALSNWEIVLPAERWHAVRGEISIPHGESDGFVAEKAGELKLEVDTNGDGKVDKNVKGTGGFLKLRSRSEKGETFNYAVRLKSDGGNWTFSSGCAMSGKVGGTLIKVIDQNLNGRYDDFGKDALLLGSGDGATLLSKVVNIDGKLYDFDINADGTEVTCKPYAGEVGMIDASSEFDSRGDLVAAVFSDKHSDWYFNAARAKKGFAVPVGSYKFHSGFVRKGAETAKMRRGKMRPVEVVAGETKTIEWGGPVVAEFDYSMRKDTIVVSPEVDFFGNSGEEYYSFTPNAKSPKIIVMDKRTRKEVASGRFGGC